MTLSQAWEDYKAKANETPLMEAAKACGATLKRAGGEYVGPCPCCGGVDRFGVNEKKAKWICRGAGGGGDAIGLVRHCIGLDFRGACQLLTGEDPPTGGGEFSAEDRAAWEKRKADAAERDKARADDEAADEKARKEIAADLWGCGVPVAGTLAETYLRRRVPGLAADLPDVLRFHPKCSAGGGRYAAALLARVDDAAGNQIGTWRIFLDANGDNLRGPDGEKIKKGLGPCGGGAVRLHPAKAGCVAVCEGIETALGVFMLTGLPVWACRTANGLSGLEIPFEIERLSIFPDGDRWKWQPDNQKWLDPTGSREALKLAEKAQGQGVEVLLQPEPPPGADFLDAWIDCYKKMEGVAV